MAMTVDALPRLGSVLRRVDAVDGAWMAHADARLSMLTKPPRSLGRLEWVAARLCAIQQTISPRAAPCRIVIFAADHGVAAEGVSAYPASVTAQMVANFLNGGAAINALARGIGADVSVIDVGVAGTIDAVGSRATFLSRRVRRSTRNMTQ